MVRCLGSALRCEYEKVKYTYENSKQQSPKYMVHFITKYCEMYSNLYSMYPPPFLIRRQPDNIGFIFLKSN
jgi:hypothetical protein